MSISGQTHEIYNLCDIDATISESRKFEKSICHFLTNRKRLFFLLANKRARRIMNRVRLNTLWSFSCIFVSCFDLILSPLPLCYCKKQMDANFSCLCPVICNEFLHNIVKVVCRSTATLTKLCYDEIHDQ